MQLLVASLFILFRGCRANLLTIFQNVIQMVSVIYHCSHNLFFLHIHWTVIKILTKHFKEKVFQIVFIISSLLQLPGCQRLRLCLVNFLFPMFTTLYFHWLPLTEYSLNLNLSQTSLFFTGTSGRMLKPNDVNKTINIL